MNKHTLILIGFILVLALFLSYVNFTNKNNNLNYSNQDNQSQDLPIVEENTNENQPINNPDITEIKKEEIKETNNPPSKIVLSPDDKKASCEENGGVWFNESSVCEINSLNYEMCTASGGEWNECNSACRHDKDAEFCTLQCVLTCSFR